MLSEVAVVFPVPWPG